MLKIEGGMVLAVKDGKNAKDMKGNERGHKQETI